jgi:3-hydroxyacyl-[acyl-carrier-protein] dehydratase
MLNNLYKIMYQREDLFRIQLASKSHPVFQAHFPGNPLLPGFLVIEICSKILRKEVLKIHKVKFLNPIFPKDILDFSFTCKEKKVEVTIFKDKQKIGQISYE